LWVFIKKNLCKNEKGRDLGTLRAQKCPRKEPLDFQLVRELAKVSQVENLSKLSAFFRFCPERFRFRRIFAKRKSQKPPNVFFGYSVVKYLKKQKSGDFSKVPRTFSRHRS
jgi:hypothetical protein